MCEDISIVDDCDVRPGVVSGGVSLLIRPAETKPTSPDIFQCGCLTAQSTVPFGNLSRSDLKSDFSLFDHPKSGAHSTLAKSMVT